MTDDLGIKFVSDFVIPASKDFGTDRHFYLFEGSVDNLDFEVYEGDGAEAFTLPELKSRNDLTSSAKYTFDHIIKADLLS